MADDGVKNEEDEKAQKKAESDAANQKAVQVAADVAANSGNAYAAAIGKGVQIADKVSGGKASELLGKSLTTANKIAPGGKAVQGLTNKVANNEIADKAYDAYKMKNGKGASDAAGKVADGAEKAKEGAEKVKEGAEKAKEGADKAKQAGAKGKDAGNQAKKGGEQDKSLPSSDGKNNPPSQGDGGSDGAENDSSEGDSADKGDKSKPDDGKKSDSAISGSFVAVILPVVIAISPLLLILLLFMPFLSFMTNFSDYEDAFGISEVAGLDTGGIDGTVSNPDQKDFYERIMEVKSNFADDGKKVDPLLVVSVFHALNTYGAEIAYSDMTKMKIEEIAGCMFDEDGKYDKNLFIDNLKEYIIPDYLPTADEETTEAIVNEVFDFIERYYALIGKTSSDCSSMGSCTYDVKGFYVNGSNFKKDMSVNDIYVRLMQCGSYNGHDAGGQWGEPLEGEELVPFEKYILGVAYQEIGASAPEHAFKAQLVAARSYILARPTGAPNSWRKLEQEGDKWVLQVAACTADQVYCDPDKGCSAENGDGQWKQVYSGTDHGQMIQGPLSESAPARRYAYEVQGETLVNDQGYIILTDYDNTESNKFIELANDGLDYKQILMEVYGDKYPSAGSMDMSKAECNGGCTSNTEASGWKQYEGDWATTELGNSGSTVKQIGCLVTSIAIQIGRSGVQTNIPNFNPGTFVEALNEINAFSDGGELLDYSSVEKVVPAFKYQGYLDVKGMDRETKLSEIKRIVNQEGVYAIAEVKGDTGQHWVAIESVSGDTINMLDPGSSNTDMWDTYAWYNTSRIVYYKVS